MSNDPRQDKKQVKTERIPPALPADKIMYTLYKANGYFYHSSFCCDYSNPHWGIVVSSTQLPEVECGRGGQSCKNKTNGSRGNKQEIEYKKDRVKPHRDNIWSLASREPLVPDSNVIDFEILDDTHEFSLIKQFENLVSFTGPDTDEIKEKSFRLRLFSHRVIFQPYDPTNPRPPAEPYYFGVADGCESGKVRPPLRLDDFEQGSPGQGDYPIFAGILNNNRKDFPILIISAP